MNTALEYSSSALDRKSKSKSFQQSLGKDENGISSAGCGVVCIAKHAQFDFYSGEIELLLPLNNKVCVLPVLKSEGKGTIPLTQ